jgi:small-conductance mechanosensitive channel
LRNDSTGRIVISISTNAASDPEKVREVLIEIAKLHDLVLSIPSPQVIFKTVSGSQLEFDLMCYVGDVLSALRVKSDLNFDIYKRFMEEKFFDGPAADPTTVKLVGIDQIENFLQRQAAARPSAAE